MSGTAHLTELYRDHLKALDGYLQDTLSRAGRSGVQLDGVLFHAGRIGTYYADDLEIAFRPTPHLRRWVPPLDLPDSVVLARPSQKPLVVRVRPQDFWFDTSPPPVSWWESEVEFHEVETYDQVAPILGASQRLAYVGSAPGAAATLGIPPELVEPAALMAPLDWHRATKTELELHLTRKAAELAGRGYQAIREGFEQGVSERELHWAYLKATEQIGNDLPYNDIIALDDKAAILHYQHKRGPETGPGKLLLVDAGADYEGYACDVTRTWTRADAHPVMTALVEGMDALERDLVAMVTPGRDYVDIHIEAHRRIGELLVETGVITGSVEEALSQGVVGAFMPHGVGHQIGLQVHDVGGHQATPEGGRKAPPSEYPLLRNTRTVEPGHLVTIEPGLYFIDMLLTPLRRGAAAGLVNWDLVDVLTPFGGVRIEDNVACTEDGFRDLTRDLIPGPRGV